MTDRLSPPGRALVTGAAGFIGYHLSERLLAAGWSVTGLDSHSPYYDPRLKAAREARLLRHTRFRAVHGRLEEPGLLAALVEAERPALVLHLAAQAGVRHSIDAPGEYVSANLEGTFRLLEALRTHPPAHLLLASTSSVYGANPRLPWRERDTTDAPLSFYAATKTGCEAMAHAHAHLHAIPTTALRFFTVYGPWGRPDMALFRFTRAVLADEPVDLYGAEMQRRDFTFVDDLAEAVMRLAARPPAPGAPVGPFDSLSPAAPFRSVNVGLGEPVALLDFLAAVEAATGRTARRRTLPVQPGEIAATWADTTLLGALAGPLPRTSLAEGVARFVAWFRGWDQSLARST